jgi:hypothetical protein
MARILGGVMMSVFVVASVGCAPVSNASTAAGEAGDEFASDRKPMRGDPLPFDSKRALGYLEQICKIGPRMSGTKGMEQQQELLKKHFEALGGKVEMQRFSGRQSSQRQAVDMSNMIVSWFPEKTRRVILCSHYDTRPIADQEPDPRKWREPFVSANDGGSGVALLMEMAHHMKDAKTDVGVDFVFFDGEEYIFEKNDKYFFGSEHFASSYRRSRAKTRYVAAILFDMIGGKGASFPMERNSLTKAGALVGMVWQIAAELQCKSFTDGVSNVEVLDDHIALNQADIPAIDIIDFDYPHWHRLTDVPANCSGESLAEVARVAGVWIQKVK